MQTSFLQRILPPLPQVEFGQLEPCYFAAGISDGRVEHVPFMRLEDGVVACNEMSARGLDTYIAPASYKSNVFGRKAVNTLQFKALWADIDVGKANNSYATLDAALGAFTEFVHRTGCKPSIVVHSGVGLQVYWVFDRAINAEAWRQLSHFFAVFCRQQGLILDPACTEDAARILRMPGTIHRKSGNTATVLIDKGLTWEPRALLGVVKRFLQDDPTLAAPAPVAVAPVATAAILQQSGMGPQPPKAKAEPIVRGCAQMLTAGLRSEPQWYAAMSVLRRCVDGLEWAHKVSATDPARYNPQDTEQKFYHAPEDAPARCERFASIEGDLCARCPHRGKISSPVQLYAQPKQLPPPTVVETPQPAPVSVTGHLHIPEKYEYPLIKLESSDFDVDQRGIIYRPLEKDKTTGEELRREYVICATQLYYTHTVKTEVDDAPRRTHWFVAIHPNGRRERLPFVIQRDMNAQSIMRWFNEANMFPLMFQLKPAIFLAFMNTYLQSVIGDNVELPTLKHFGWTDFIDPVLNTEVEGFAVGKGVVTETGIHHVQFTDVAGDIAKKEMDVKGDLETWKRIPQMYKTLDQKEAQLAVCLSFAAPFMRYGAGSATSAAYSLWSTRSGLGKTQVIKACASVWGNPERQLIQRSSSQVMRGRKMAALRNLPVFMDELTDVKDEDMYSLAYTLVEGKEKQKLKANGAEMVKTGEWNTVSFITANRSFKEAAAKHAGDSEASIIRVMETECGFQSYADKPAVQEYIQCCIDLCSRHYGLAGPEFMYQILQHRDRLETLTRWCDRWVSMHNFTSAERFISYPLALAIKVGRWACEFGLLDYDMDALEKWAIEVFVAHNRVMTERNRTHHEDVLRMYLMDRQSNTLIVSRHERPVDSPEAPRGLLDKYIIGQPSRDTYVRVEEEEGYVYVATSDIASWCKARKLSSAVLLKELAASGLQFIEMKQSLSYGISWMRLPVISCIRFAVKNLEATTGYSFGARDEQVDE